MRCPTLDDIYTLASEKRQRFFAHIRTVYELPRYHLLRIAKESGYTPLMRAAALRVLVASAPLEVTQGLPYCQRRRRVRAFYGI